MTTITAIQSNSLIRDISKDHVKRGTKKMAAIGVCMHKILGVCMHKILRIIYGMLKHNKKFDMEIDLKNREKRYKQLKKVRQDKNRRYQNFDSKAPISRRQKLKRKEDKLSHSDLNTKCYFFDFHQKTFSDHENRKAPI